MNRIIFCCASWCSSFWGIWGWRHTGGVFTKFWPSADGQGSAACIMPSDMESESARERREKKSEREESSCRAAGCPACVCAGIPLLPLNMPVIFRQPRKRALGRPTPLQCFPSVRRGNGWEPLFLVTWCDCPVLEIQWGGRGWGMGQG